jgi:hypothetical protein
MQVTKKEKVTEFEIWWIDWMIKSVEGTFCYCLCDHSHVVNKALSKCRCMCFACDLRLVRYTIGSNSLVVFSLKYLKLNFAFSEKISIRWMLLTLKKTVIIVFRRWRIGQAIGSTSFHSIVHVRDCVQSDTINDSLPVNRCWNPTFAWIPIAEPSLLLLQGMWFLTICQSVRNLFQMETFHTQAFP